jgi:hypothetical protein
MSAEEALELVSIIIAIDSLWNGGVCDIDPTSGFVF